MTHIEIVQDIKKQMTIIHNALDDGKMATLNTEILIAHIKGNSSIEGDIKGLDVVAKYYLDMINKIDNSEKRIENDLKELDKMVKE